MKILVVEDDRSVRETLGIVLECYNYSVDLVDGGEAALSYLEKDWPDAMLLDLSLIGMSGEEVFEQIRARFGNIPPTVVLSAVQHGEQRIRNMPGARFLAKPYTLDQLMAVIEQVTHKKSPAA